MADDDDFRSKEDHKSHQKPHSGRKAEKKKNKNEMKNDESQKGKNPKAFAFKSAVKAERRFRRKQDLIAKKEHIPLVDRTPLEPPPYVVALVGPANVGKTTLMRCLIRNYTRQNLNKIEGPVTVVSGKKRRLTFIECNNDINNMIDVAKIADLALLLIDASFGFEMETFEFLNICQAHGFPRIMGVLTHLDTIKNKKRLKRIKKTLKHRFWTEVYQGAKLFYLSGMVYGDYLKNEVHNLGRFISVMKFRPLQWRTTHPYLLVDRIEDLTNQELIRQNPKCNRIVSLYGYSRGSFFKQNNEVHIPGCGDFVIKEISFLHDPCPLPSTEKTTKRRSLNEKERMIYAPMSGVGGIVYDKDAVYIELGGSHSHKNEDEDQMNEYVSSIISNKQTIDEKMAETELKLFSDAIPATEDKTKRRKVTFDDGLSDDEESDDDENEDENDSEDPSDSEDDNDESDKEFFADKENEIENVKEKLCFMDSSDDDEEKEEENGLLKWKNNITEKAAFSYYSRLEKAENIQKLVYGDAFSLKEDDYYSDVKQLSGGLFHVVQRKVEEIQKMKATLNSIESTKFPVEQCDWTNPDMMDSIRDCFVTGKWADNEDAQKLLERNNETSEFDDDNEMFGDFEDYETGEKHKADESKDEIEMDDKNDDEDEMKERMEKKRKLKEAFDSEYDQSGKETQAEKTFYDEMKEELNKQAQVRID